MAEPNQELVISERRSDEATSETIDTEAWLAGLLQKAVDAGVTDMRIRYDRKAKTLTVAARENRMMIEWGTLTGAVAQEIDTRLKTAANLPSGTSRRFLFGRYNFAGQGTEARDLRITVYPTVIGETIVVRLPTDTKLPQLSNIRMSDHTRQRVDACLGYPSGLVMMVGPMGSGKTFMLTALTLSVSGPEVTAISVEDPAERTLPGIDQIEINVEAGNGYPDVLRGVRRSDAQVLMLGEILEPVAAAAAVEISNAGARVFTTIHANDSVAAIAALQKLSGADPGLVATQIRGIISQRILRTICRTCQGAGCPTCANTGYSGFTTIHEALLMSEELIDAVMRGLSHAELTEVARAGGMKSLWEDAETLIAEGITSEAEARRVLGPRPIA